MEAAKKRERMQTTNDTIYLEGIENRRKGTRRKMTKHEYLQRLNKLADFLNSLEIELNFLEEDIDELPCGVNKNDVFAIVNDTMKLHKRLYGKINDLC